MIPLNRTCDVYRGTSGNSLHGMDTTITWNKVGTFRCRPDFLARLSHSHLDRSTEAYVGRLRGHLFLDTTADVQERDIVVINGSGPYAGRQFDIEWNDAVDDGIGFHHCEAVMSVRVSDMVLTP